MAEGLTWRKNPGKPNTTANQLLILSLILENNGRGGGTVNHPAGNQWKSWCMRETTRQWPWNVAPTRSNWLVKPYLYMQFITSHLLGFCNSVANWQNYLNKTSHTCYGRVLLVGNFNIHIDKKATPDTITFYDMLEGLNLRNNTRDWNAYIRSHPST